MQITNLNPDADIGASAWHVDSEGHGLLLDAGIHPKRDGKHGLPLLDRVPVNSVDAIAISHCHHDHVGALPVALRRFPHANVLMTELSYFLVERILHNSVNVMERQKTEHGIREYPLYTHNEVDEYAAVFQGFKYRRPIEWTHPHRRKPGAVMPTLEFLDAGHTLGSAGVLVRGARKTLLYSGDVCFHDQTILRAADFGDVRADVLILETTRGARAVPPGFTRESEVERLAESVIGVLKRKGSVLIPAFGLGRTQEILALLAVWMSKGRIKRQPVYLGGLGRVFTEIYDLESHRANRNLSNLKLTEALDLRVLSPKQVDGLRLTGGNIFVLTSGMMNANTAAHDLAVRLLRDEKHGIFFVGYADPDTPGGRLKGAKAGEKFHFSEEVGDLKRRCQLADFDLSAHANREDLLELVGQVEPKTVILGHGDGPARAWMAGEIKKRFPRARVYQPGPGEKVRA
jgi:Cft2 family RNA processing exonuclease